VSPKSENLACAHQSYGEDTLAADWSILEKQSKLILIEWRKSCERLFKFVTIRCSYEGFGSGVTVVLSDSRCNQHITNEGSVERAVRLPAALKGAKLAGAGATPSCLMQLRVEEYYMKLATDKFLEKAHAVSYLKKMKARCSAIAPNVNGVHLTEGSDGEGGCDTSKCILLRSLDSFVSTNFIDQLGRGERTMRQLLGSPQQ
jgi:hypothetical protein